MVPRHTAVAVLNNAKYFGNSFDCSLPNVCRTRSLLLLAPCHVCIVREKSQCLCNQDEQAQSMQAAMRAGSNAEV